MIEHQDKGIPLPFYVVDKNNQIVEIITLDVLSGGADYVNEMPAQLILSRQTEQTTFTANYTQVKNNMPTSLTKRIELASGAITLEAVFDAKTLTAGDRSLLERLFFSFEQAVSQEKGIVGYGEAYGTNAVRSMAVERLREFFDATECYFRRKTFSTADRVITLAETAKAALRDLECLFPPTRQDTGR